jgi:predicted outer membrane repeat protein
LGNGLHGVYVATNSDGHALGGTGAGEGNVIAHNGGIGVFVDNNCGAAFCLRNAIVGNSVFGNAGLGIDLSPSGVNANDALDADTGANGRQNFPVIDAVEAASNVLTATGTLSSSASTAFDLHFYSNAACDPGGSGEGAVYLGVISATSDAAGVTTFTATLTAAVPDGSRITATATDPAGNTSEFSACSLPTGYAPISGLQAVNDSPTFLGMATGLTATITGGTGVSYAWNLGDGQSAAGASVSHVFDAIGVYTAVVTATNSGSQASTTTTVTIVQPPACAATHDDGLTVFASDDAQAVQQAVDAAPAGGTVKVAGACAGVDTRGGVTQTVYLDKPLTMRGGYSFLDWSQSLPHTRPTTLDANGMGRVVFITNTAAVSIENLTLQYGVAGGVAADCPTAGCGGGLYTNSSLALQNVNIRDNLAPRAGGAYVLGPLDVVDTTWQDNTCTQVRGGALEAYGATTLTGGLVSGNACRYGGGVFVDAALTVSGTHFISNTATSPSSGSGGAIYADGALTLTNARFERNTAQTGAGAVLHTGTASDQLTISATTFISNTAFHTNAQGGALYTSVPVAHISDSQFDGNSTPASLGSGGAIVAFNAITLTKVTLHANFAGSQGGAVYHWGLSESGDPYQIRPLILSNTVLSGNQAGSEGGALYFRRGFAAANVPIHLSGATFLSNTAVFSGGAAYLGQPATITGGAFLANASAAGAGGGLYAEDALSTAATVFQDNAARRAGGAYVLGVLEAVDTNWQGNQCGSASGVRGGGLEAYSATTLTGGLFSGNTCSYGGGLFVDAALTISATQFISNTATSPTVGSGGAMYANGTLTLANAWFERNTAHTGAGAVLHTGAAGDALSVTNSTFISNTALNASAQGGGLYTSAPAATIAGSLFEGNITPGANGAGGALVAFKAITLTNVRLHANFAGGQGGALYHWGLSEAGDPFQILPLVLSDTLLTGNQAGSEGGALYFRRGFAAANVPIHLSGAIFLSNTAVLSGGAAFLGQPGVVAHSRLQGNTSGGAGGGLLAQDSLDLEGTRLYDNAAATGGGLAIAAQPGSTSRIANAVLGGNQAAVGAGLALLSAGRVEVMHTTIAGPAVAAGQAIYATGSTVNVTNTIVASHTVGLERGPSGLLAAERNLFFGNTSDAAGSVSNSDPVGGEPGFLDPEGGDYHLVLGSAGLDAGLDVGLGHDFEADLRHIGAGPDIGADEFGAAGIAGPGGSTQLGVTPRPGQRITLTVPSGAVGAASVIRLAPLVTPTRPLPPGRLPSSMSFSLEAEALAALDATTSATFLVPLVVEVQYTDADPGGQPEASLRLLWWDAAQQLWRPAQASCAAPQTPGHVPEANRLAVQVCEAGEFALTSGPLQVYLPLVGRQ